MEKTNRSDYIDHLDNKLMLLFIQRIMEDRPLGEVDVTQFGNHFFSGVWSTHKSEKEIQAIIKRFNQAIPNFLNGMATMLENFAESHKKILKKMEEDRKSRLSLPQGVSDMDHPDVIALGRKLTDMYYTFSAAEKLVKTTRQTLQTYAKSQQHGLRLHYPTGKSPKLSREDLVAYYRQRFHNDYDFFEDLASGRRKKE